MPALSIDHAYNYVKQLLAKLPAALCFHNWQHTVRVFEMSRRIGQHSNLKPNDLHILELAALFHDSGYLYQYEGHEERSIFLAGVYLKSQNYDTAVIAKVSGCINATRLPQTPTNNLEEILCDADLGHFASASYLDLAGRLKEEWEIKQGRKINPNEWDKENLFVLNRHAYFTAYGKTVLQRRKENNIHILENRIKSITP